MALRARHGRARAFGVAPVLECLPCDELPAGVPAEAEPPTAPGRDPNGRFLPGNASAARGGRAKAGRTKLAASLGLSTLPSASVLARYKAGAESLRRATTTSLAKSVGGGEVGPLPGTLVASGSLALAWSRYFFDQAALLAASNPTQAATFAGLGAKLSESSSRLLREAFEYAAREAEIRKASEPRKDPLEDFMSDADAYERAVDALSPVEMVAHKRQVGDAAARGETWAVAELARLSETGGADDADA